MVSNQEKGLAILIHSTVSMMLVKPVIWIIIYVGFFVIEAATFQSWVIAAKDTEAILLDLPGTFNPSCDRPHTSAGFHLGLWLEPRRWRTVSYTSCMDMREYFRSKLRST